jgi:hypothetical protein
LPLKPDGDWGRSSKELAARFIRENMGGGVVKDEKYVAGDAEPSQPLLEVLVRKRLLT